MLRMLRMRLRLLLHQMLVARIRRSNIKTVAYGEMELLFELVASPRSFVRSFGEFTQYMASRHSYDINVCYRSYSQVSK